MGNATERSAAPGKPECFAYVGCRKPRLPIIKGCPDVMRVKRKNGGGNWVCHKASRELFKVHTGTFPNRKCRVLKTALELLTAFRQSLGHIGHTRQRMTNFTPERGQKKRPNLSGGVSARGVFKHRMDTLSRKRWRCQGRFSQFASMKTCLGIVFPAR